MLDQPESESKIENDEPAWSLDNLSIAYHPAEQRFQVNFKCKEGKVIASAMSNEELVSILHAIGNKVLWPRTESLDEALARGLKITRLPTMFAFGGDHRQNQHRHAMPETKLANPSARFTRQQLASLTLDDLL